MKYFSKKNIKMRNNNIYNLDNELYADLKCMRFSNIQYLEDYKFSIKIFQKFARY